MEINDALNHIRRQIWASTVAGFEENDKIATRIGRISQIHGIKLNPYVYGFPTVATFRFFAQLPGGGWLPPIPQDGESNLSPDELINHLLARPHSLPVIPIVWYCPQDGSWQLAAIIRIVDDTLLLVGIQKTLPIQWQVTDVSKITTVNYMDSATKTDGKILDMFMIHLLTLANAAEEASLRSALKHNYQLRVPGGSTRLYISRRYDSGTSKYQKDMEDLYKRRFGLS